MIVEKLLSEPSWRHICFIEDEGDEAEAPPPSETDQLAEILAEEEAPPETDEAELEIGPEKIKVHKSVKEAWDGLQKTIQTHAEGRTAAERRAEAEGRKAQEMLKLGGQVIEDLGEIKAIDRQLDPYLKLTQADWIAWGQQDADAANKAWNQIQALQRDKALKQEALNGKVRTLQEGESRTVAEQKLAAEAEMAKAFPNWATLKPEIQKGAEALKVPSQYVDVLLQSPWAVSIIQDALTLRDARAKIKAKPAAQEAPPPEPVTKIRGNNSGGGSNDLRDNVPIEQWAKNFRKTVLHQRVK